MCSSVCTLPVERRQNFKSLTAYIVTCMDPRVQSISCSFKIVLSTEQPFSRPYEQLGLKIGEAVITRNAGGSVYILHNIFLKRFFDQVTGTGKCDKSIIVAQLAFNISNIAVVHHTGTFRKGAVLYLQSAHPDFLYRHKDHERVAAQ